MAKKTTTKEANKKPEGRPVPKEIQLRLTPQQCLERTDRASRLNEEKTTLQKEFEAEEKEWKQRRAKYKNDIKNMQEQVDKYLAEVKAKAATSTEQVILVLNHDEGVAEYWFQMDGKTWEIVETRPLEDNERQMSMIEDRVKSMPQTGQTLEV